MIRPRFSTILISLVLFLSLLAAALEQANYLQNLTLISIMVSVGLFALVAALVRRPAGGAWPIGPAGGLLIALLGWSALAITWSDVPYLTVIDVATLGTVVLAYAAWRIVTAEDDRHPSPVMVWGLLLAGLAMALLMSGQFFTGHRPMALFANPNSAAALVNVLWPTVAVAWLDGADRLLRAPRMQRALLPILFFLVFAVGIDGSRAAFLAGVAALIVVLAGAAVALNANRRQLLVVALVFLGGLATAYLVNILGLGTGRLLGERIASLASPEQAGGIRFAQWAATWELIKEAPWLGIGPDVFWLAYQAVRPAGDGSAGMFAHNDYLHFWAERGLPGPLLVIALGAACIYLFSRGLRARREREVDTDAAAIMIAAFAAVVGLGIHGIFSYQLQMPSILIPAFILIAELERLGPVRSWVNLPLPNWRRPLSLTAGVGMLVLIIFGAGLTGAAQRQTEAAIEYTSRGQFDAAETALRTAQRRWGWADPPWVYQAVLYQRLLGAIPETQAALRRELMAEAMDALDTAKARNPHRALIPTVRGELLRDHPELAEGSARESLEAALALNPRSVPARLAYADLIRETEGEAAAHRVLEAGVALRYGNRAAPLALYREAIKARAATGDYRGAMALEARIRSIRERLRRLSQNG